VRAERELAPRRVGETLQRIERLAIADALAGVVDVLERMRGPVFDEARSPGVLRRSRSDRETATVVWPGGADLAPDTLYERIRTGTWPEQDVAA
jgi:hypothetical protein